MKINTLALEPDKFYHIYNRGINGEDIFKEERNYAYFLQKCALYLNSFLEIYAYCLLKNHFHLLIRTRSGIEIMDLVKDNEKNASWHLSNAFASSYKSYAQAINKAYKRTGALFEEPFRRVEVKTDAYFSYLIYYIHSNPQKHGFCDDFKEYPHSSYPSHLSNKSTRLARESVIGWFGDKEQYQIFHNQYQDLKVIQNLMIEFD